MQHAMHTAHTPACALYMHRKEQPLSDSHCPLGEKILATENDVLNQLRTPLMRKARYESLLKNVSVVQEHCNL